jgi:hypothetical protein
VGPESTLAQTKQGRKPVQVARQSVGEQIEWVGILLWCEIMWKGNEPTKSIIKGG